MGTRIGIGEVLMATAVPPTDVAMEQALKSMQDTQHRALLLQARAGAMRRQQRGLQDAMQRLQNQHKRLQDIERSASGVQRPALASLGRQTFSLETPVLCTDPFLGSRILNSTP